MAPGCDWLDDRLTGGILRGAAGFGFYFEAKVARELADFCERFDDRRDRLWLALPDSRPVGSVVIDGSRADQEGAHRR